jgi:phenylpropionate dioxygenase-like ring-hydroxylating dioxygenase large terminal subunit
MLKDRDVPTADEAAQLLASLEAGRALPSSWYTDTAIFERERALLRRSWHYGGSADALARPGDRVVCQVAGVPLVLVRDADEIRGFVNICRHRAHLVATESGNHHTLECQHDGWVYGLDGELRRAPRAEDEATFDAAQFGLIPVQTAVWGPTVWVNVAQDAPPFFDWIAGLPELVASHGLDVTAQVKVLERSWEIRANWKVFLDNAIECYHCPTCHPSLSQVLEMDPDLHDLMIGGRWWISHRVPLRKDAVATSPSAPTGSQNDDSVYYYFHWIFPTTYFQYAGPGFDIGTVDVLGVNRILFRHLTFLPAGTDPEDIAEHDRRLDEDPTVSEDVAICHRVQRAHQANAVPPGRLLPRSEWLLQHFQRVLIEELAPSPAPVGGVPT